LGIFSVLDASFVAGCDAGFGANAAVAFAGFMVSFFAAFCFLALLEPRSFATLVSRGAFRPLIATC